jgi:hypothetical protein
MAKMRLSEDGKGTYDKYPRQFRVVKMPSNTVTKA